MLEVRLIGKFAIRCDGKPVTISSRAAQSLFAYLILNAGTSHRREMIAGKFWPDVTEEKARAYLRHELWRLRKALPHTQKVECLLADDLTIAFDQSSKYWLDVAALKNISDNASADELITALSLYQGELLPGFYEDWVVLEREHLQAVYERKMARLLELLEIEKSWPEILEWAERWISLGHRPEAAYQALMVAYDALGDRAKVASTYERCMQTLHALGLEPSQQTRALAFRWPSSLNIPVSLTSFIGRKREIREIVALLSSSRLVTLTGSGGVGKTRLSIQVVLEVLGLFPDGVWFFDLAFLNDPAFVPNALASVLGLRDIATSKLSILDLLKGYLQSRTALLIFDNCEHLIESCAQLADSLLKACPALHIFATSREALRIAGEIPYRVPSLEIPRSDIESAINVLANIESVRLFIERAAVTSPGFEISPKNVLIIAQICRRLDGIPLAIELAAARADILTVEQILKRLDDRFNLLKRGLRTSLPRHQTLHATIEWSYSLLSEQERILFRRLAVFVGGWTLEAAEEVCGGNGLEASDVLDLFSQLVNKSLVGVEFPKTGETRYRRLESIRQFAREKLSASGEEEMMRQRHLSYFLQLAERAEPEIRSHNQVIWLNRLENELDNLRTALEWSRNCDAEFCLRLASALWRFWDIRGYADEGLEWMTKTLSNTESLRTEIHARALARASQVASNNGYFKQAEFFANKAYDLAKELNDKPSLARALLILSTLEIVRFREQTGLEFLEESLRLSREIEDHGLVASIFFNLANQARNHDLVSTISFMEQGLKEARISGDKRLISHGLQQLSLYSLVQGNTENAQNFAEEAFFLIKEMDDKANTLACYWLFADIALFSESYVTAEEHSMKAKRFAESQNDKHGLAISLLYLSLVSWATGDLSNFRAQAQEALTLAKEGSDQYLILELLIYLGEAFRLNRYLTRAKSCYQEALAILQQENIRAGYCIYLEGIATLAIAEGQRERGARLLGSWEKLRETTFVVDNTFIVDSYPFLVRQRQALMAAVHMQLGEEAFQSSWQAGRAMSLEQALGYILEGIS